MLCEIEKKNEIEELIEREKQIASASKAIATKKAYRSDWSGFQRWTNDVELSDLPAHPDTVRLYIAWLDKTGKKPSTIKRAITSIRLAHTLAGFPSPITDSVKETQKGLLRLRGVAPTKKSPLTLNKLDRLLLFISSDCIGVRDKAIILVGWTGGLRRSEIVNLCAEDLEQQAEGIAVIIRRSKIDQFGNGKTIGLPYLDDNQQFCAARALTKWLALSKIEKGPLFYKIGKTGKDSFFPRKEIPREEGLRPQQVQLIVQKYAELAGYNPREFGGHSLRSGLATTLASVGIEERRIMQITGHRSLPILREYIQRGELFLEHPIKQLFDRNII